jgi:hypothetical protein
VLADPVGKQMHDLVKAGKGLESFDLLISSKIDGTNTMLTDQEFPKGPWEEIIDAAEAANAPGMFTALIGYEWGSLPDGSNLHRVLVYRDGKEKANTRIPLSSALDPDPEHLWGWMASYEAETGGRILAIPHNGNVSNGLMFDDVTLTTQEPLSAAYAQRRARWEPLYEVTQMKGDGETHPMLSPDDAFADFHTWDKGSFGPAPKTPEMLPREYAREALWDAMMRKEAYATTGTRLRVRVFAGYDFEASDLPRSDFAKHGYENGVPMGADLAQDAKGRAPRFIVRALRDPDGANLDRIQIVKGWLNADGTTTERIYDIACGGRDLKDVACDGEVGNTVNAEKASYTNDIGQAILAGFWADPDFDPAQSAFYYVRVLEIPTPRWTTYDAKVFGVDIPEGAPIAIQERAYTSPNWYSPPAKAGRG